MAAVIDSLVLPRCWVAGRGPRWPESDRNLIYGQYFELHHDDLAMPSEHPVQKTQNGGSSSAEPKIRGANRSTKVAGKLKVLPEQPELVTAKAGELPGPPKDVDENVATTGDSDEGDIDDDEDDDGPKDVEVISHHSALSVLLMLQTGVQPNLFNSRRKSQERRFKINQKESQVPGQSDSVCDGSVSLVLPISSLLFDETFPGLIAFQK
jgi:hypothetical protein